MGRDIDTRQYGQEYADSRLHTPGMSRCEHGNYACLWCADKYTKQRTSACCDAEITQTGFCTDCKENV